MPKPAGVSRRRVTWLVIRGNSCLCLRCRCELIVNWPITVAAFTRWARSVMAQHAGCKEKKQ